MVGALTAVLAMAPVATAQAGGNGSHYGNGHYYGNPLYPIVGLAAAVVGTAAAIVALPFQVIGAVAQGPYYPQAQGYGAPGYAAPQAYYPGPAVSYAPPAPSYYYGAPAPYYAPRPVAYGYGGGYRGYNGNNGYPNGGSYRPHGGQSGGAYGGNYAPRPTPYGPPNGNYNQRPNDYNTR